MDSYTLKSVSDLPAPFRSIFRFRYFNSLQSECFPICFHSNVNMVISAPTGSGKTVLFELCILRLLSSFLSEERFLHAKGTLKTIYIAPSKALVQEKLRDWNQKFEGWGISCLELTGDNEMYNTKNIQEADIILTTPEKFDAVTRCRIKDGGLSFFGDIALLLIDEVHLLNDPRGAALEAIVSRIKMIARIPEMNSTSLANIRLLAVSATIPNIEDLAEWLMVPAQGVKRFGEEMRPVKLTTKVFGYTSAKNDFLFEKRLQNYIFDILMQYSKGKSALVFCSTRKGAQEAAQRLTQQVMTFGYSNPFIKSQEQLESLKEASMSCSDKLMQSYILYGVGYHNGGLCMKDRNLVESLFLKGDIHVLCTTNTLAHGINLPAHTVVIKSTQHFNKEKGLYMEYDRSTILQMCGRAGRPPFDDTGTVIIMTRRETVHLYEDLLNGCEIVESQLLCCVTEHLTAEIVQMTITDITKAIEWMKCSYMYVRMKKNPEKYAVNDRVEKHMQEICIKKINELSQHQLIWTDEDCFLLKPLEPGRLMSKYYLKFNTMKQIIHATVNCSLDDTLHIICRAEELAWIQLRRNEKKLLNDINNDKDGRLRFHILGENGKRKKRIQTREEKIFVLTNDCLTGDPSIHDLALTQDVNSICSNGCRISKCMKEYYVHKKNYRGALSTILLAKSLYQKLWEDSPFLLKQLPGIGVVTAKALQTMGVTSFETLSEADPRKIEIVTGRKYPFGNHIKDSLLSLPPKVELKIEEIDCPMQGKSKLEISLTRLAQSVQTTKRHFADMIVGSEEENLILFHEKIRVDEFSSPYKANVLLSKPQQGKLTVKADLIFEEYIGIDIHQKLVVWESKSNRKNKVAKSKELKFPPNEKVCVSYDGNNAWSLGPQKDIHNSANPVMENAFMPSFNLLDEDLADGIRLLHNLLGYNQYPSSLIASSVKIPEIIAGEPVVRSKEDERMIITEQTVFDHIREKAKSFNVLSAPKSIFSLAPETLNTTRRFTHEKKPELPTEVEVPNNTARGRLQALTNSFLESNRGGQLKDNNNCQLGAVESGNTMDERSGDVFQTVMTQETVFDHIRKKSRNFPMIGTLNQRDLESFIQMNEHSVVTDSKSEGIFKDMNCIRKTIAKSKNKTDSANARYGSPNPALKTASADVYTSWIDSLLFDICGSKRNKQPNPVNSEYITLKQQSLPVEPSCSRETESEIREVDPFAGYKSVFSFL